MLTLFDPPTRDAILARVDDDLKLFGNFGHLFANGVQAYGHANYAEKTATQGFYYRNPNTRANTRANIPRDVLDAQDIRDGSAGCPAVPITDHRPDQAALAQVIADPNCFNFQSPRAASPRASRGRSPMCHAGVRRTARTA